MWRAAYLWWVSGAAWGCWQSPIQIGRGTKWDRGICDAEWHFAGSASFLPQQSFLGLPSHPHRLLRDLGTLLPLEEHFYRSKCRSAAGHPGRQCTGSMGQGLVITTSTSWRCHNIDVWEHKPYNRSIVCLGFSLLIICRKGRILWLWQRHEEHWALVILGRGGDWINPDGWANPSL